MSLPIKSTAAALILGGAVIFLSVGAASRTAPRIEQQARSLPAVPANGEAGFVLFDFAPAIYPGLDQPCPAGFSGNTRETFLEMLPPAERSRLSRKENEPELTRLWKAASLGPNNINICSNYDMFPQRALQKLVQSKISFGMNLDQDASGDTCSHEEFVSPEGEAGVDNQLYRALGCSTSWRAPDGSQGETALSVKNDMVRGEYKIVMLVRGIQSLRRDDDVEIVLASTDDTPIVDAQQTFVRGATFNVSPNPRWRAVFHGRIENGVLTSDAADVNLSRPFANGGPRAQHGEFNFSRARMRITFAEDGSMEGIFAGYQPIFNVIYQSVRAGVGAAQVAGVDCASQYNTLVKLADGGRDPRTGKCTRISSAYHIAGVPAYVIDRAGGMASAHSQ